MSADDVYLRELEAAVGRPADELPVVVAVEVHATVRNDEPVAVLVLADPAGELRRVQLSTSAVLDTIEGLARFVRQVTR